MANPVATPVTVPTPGPFPVANPTPQALVVASQPEAPQPTMPLPTAAPIPRRCGILRLGLFCAMTAGFLVDSSDSAPMFDLQTDRGGVWLDFGPSSTVASRHFPLGINISG
jgi:hypothetical protein